MSHVPQLNFLLVYIPSNLMADSLTLQIINVQSSHSNIIRLLVFTLTDITDTSCSKRSY